MCGEVTEGRHLDILQFQDGWNRGKFGPIEKFITCFETLEREKAGIPIDAAG